MNKLISKILAAAFLLSLLLIGSESHAATAMKYTQDELYLLAKIVQAEAGPSHTEGQRAVAAVVVNRVRSSKFPNTISKVIYQKGQFSPVRTKKFAKLKPSKKCIENAKYVLEGNHSFPSKVQFFKSARLSKKWGSRKFYKNIGGNYFYS